MRVQFKIHSLYFNYGMSLIKFSLKRWYHCKLLASMVCLSKPFNFFISKLRNIIENRMTNGCLRLIEGLLEDKFCFFALKTTNNQ